MNYIDGFVAAVPQENKQKFIDHVREASLLIKSYGASRVVECWGEMCLKVRLLSCLWP